LKGPAVLLLFSQIRALDYDSKMQSQLEAFIRRVQEISEDCLGITKEAQRATTETLKMRGTMVGPRTDIDHIV
jgi:hypothetical protein